MKNYFSSVVVDGRAVPLIAQEKRDMPMKGEMPVKGQGMQGGGVDRSKMKNMQGRMSEMRKSIGGMARGQGMMRSEETQGMRKGMGEKSEMVGEMGQMMGGGKMTPSADVRDVEDDARYVRHDEADSGADGPGNEADEVKTNEKLVWSEQYWRV